MGRRLRIAGLALIALMMWGGCSRSTPQSSTRDGAMAHLGQQADHAAGIAWTIPAHWSPGAARPMRVATYQIPPAGSDSEPAECAVYFFGTGQGGSVEANLDRWATQFAQPDGRPAVPQEQERTINGITVHTIRVEGTFLAAAGPMTTVTQTKPGYAMLGAIVEAPQGLVFFKFIGPAKTISAGQAEFDAMLGSLRVNNHPSVEIPLGAIPRPNLPSLPDAVMSVNFSRNGKGFRRIIRYEYGEHD